MRHKKSSWRLETPISWMSGTREAWGRLVIGRKILEKPEALAISTTLMMPRTGLKSPLRDNSPTKRELVRS